MPVPVTSPPPKQSPHLVPHCHSLPDPEANPELPCLLSPALLREPSDHPEHILRDESFRLGRGLWLPDVVVSGIMFLLRSFCSLQKGLT
jgi:hypothetical protein